MKVILLAAVTVDGMIGRDSGHTADWTSKEDKQLFVRVTKEAGTIVMGSKTFKTIGRALPGRRNIIMTRSPENITTEGVEATSEQPQLLVKRLEDEGVESLVVCGGAQIYDLFMRAGLVDELYITIEPLMFGTGVSLCTQPIETHLQLLNTKQLNENSVVLHYKVLR